MSSLLLAVPCVFSHFAYALNTNPFDPYPFHEVHGNGLF
jgi:hypothetical protein